MKAASASAEAELLSLSGEVSVRRAGQTDWSAVSEETLFSEGDTVRTGKNASAELSIDEEDNILASLGENTTAILRGKALERIELSGGRIRSLVKKLEKGSGFEIKTPTIVAAARGSGWDVDYDGESTTVKAFEDNISVESIDEMGRVSRAVSLDQGFQISVNRQRKFSDRKPIQAADKYKWKKWKDRKRPPRKSIIKGKIKSDKTPRSHSGERNEDARKPSKNHQSTGIKNRRR